MRLAPPDVGCLLGAPVNAYSLVELTSGYQRNRMVGQTVVEIAGLVREWAKTAGVPGVTRS